MANLAVATEIRTGYDRDLFPHWIDADSDGCNTRYEVLIAEAVVTRRRSARRARSAGGRWYSYYDNRSLDRAADLDIDHVVALAEAWDSGARNWTTSRRRAYANDLGDGRALIAVTDSVNQAKGDRDPATWMPSYAPARCRYVGEWVAVKIRWRLTVDVPRRTRSQVGELMPQRDHHGAARVVVGLGWPARIEIRPDNVRWRRLPGETLGREGAS